MTAGDMTNASDISFPSLGESIISGYVRSMEVGSLTHVSATFYAIDTIAAASMIYASIFSCVFEQTDQFSIHRSNAVWDMTPASVTLVSITGQTYPFRIRSVNGS